jgi:hypothetical protein
MNTEEAREDQRSQGPRRPERGLEPARDRDLPWRSVEVLRDLCLSKEKIVGYHCRFSDSDGHNRPRPATGRASARTPPARKILIVRFAVSPSACPVRRQITDIRAR